MTYVVAVLGISLFIELVLHVLYPWKIVPKLTVSFASCAVIAGATAVILLYSLNIFTLLLTFLSAYRIFNAIRQASGRMHHMYLRHESLRTSLRLGLVQLVTVLVWQLYELGHISAAGLWTAALAIQLVLSVWFFYIVVGHIKRLARSASAAPISDKDLPTLTVAVPARNETKELQVMLQSLVDSQYPKLEILVFDDCSQATRTPEIIKSFAHDGVRFLRGTNPSGKWLAKNQAYASLAEAANGDVIMFCGADITVTPGTIRQLMAYMMHYRKEMVSVMPRNVVPSKGLPFIQPMRYLWELALPRMTFGHPPVLGSCWLISREALRSSGGFKAVANMVIPESYFASKLAEKDTYGFITSGDIFGVQSGKSIREQRDTAIRVMYPQLKRRPDTVAALTLVYALWVGIPFSTVLAISLATSSHLLFLATLSVAVILMNGLLYGLLLKIMYGRARILHVLSLPLSALAYVACMNYSMYKYEFSEVIWKGRNVCLPAMQAIPRFPKV